MSAGKDGATAGELLLALVDRVSHRGGDTLSLMNEAGTTLPQILFLARLRQAGGGTASDLANQLKQGLGGLFGKKKQDPQPAPNP